MGTGSGLRTAVWGDVGMPAAGAVVTDFSDREMSAHDPAALSSQWLDQFEAALMRFDQDALQLLFVDDCHWRDLVSMTWTISQFRGRPQIVQSLCNAAASVRPAGFCLAENRTGPRIVSRAGVEVIESIFRFETMKGRGYGVLRLLASSPQRAWCLLTSLHELKGFEEPLRERRRMGSGYTRDFAAGNWLDQRKQEALYDDRDPAVLVVGAGQSGLAVAASLRLLGVDTLIVERHSRVGDNWRNRYHALFLHNEIQRNHLPYLNFPPHWPRFLPKDMLADWFETYAMAMELNVWTDCQLVSGRYDEAGGTWDAMVRRKDGSQRALKPRHIVFANGVNGLPRLVDFPGMDAFRGKIIHTHDYAEGSCWKGKRAIVIGTGACGHDVAQDLHSHGAQVTLMQRGSTTVTSLEASQSGQSVFRDGFPLEDSDLISAANTYPLQVRAAQINAQRMLELDRALHSGLTARGFKHDQGEDDTGYEMKLLRYGGRYYLNVGCSDLIISGAIGLFHHDQMERFVADGILLRDGRIEKADLIVTATGYLPTQEMVRQILGDENAERTGITWGVDDDGEVRNMYRPTAQKGLWFMGGGLAQCRIYSKPLALQIKAHEEGLCTG